MMLGASHILGASPSAPLLEANPPSLFFILPFPLHWGTVSFPSWVQSRATAAKAFLVYFQPRKCVWQQPFWFLLWEPKCLPEPKVVSVLTIVCKGPNDTVGLASCTYGKGLGVRHESWGEALTPSLSL